DRATMLDQTIGELGPLLSWDDGVGDLWIRLSNINWSFRTRDGSVGRVRARVIDRIYARSIGLRQVLHWNRLLHEQGDGDDGSYRLWVVRVECPEWLLDGVKFRREIADSLS